MSWLFNAQVLIQCWYSAHTVSWCPPHLHADLLFPLIKNLVWNRDGILPLRCRWSHICGPSTYRTHSVFWWQSWKLEIEENLLSELWLDNLKKHFLILRGAEEWRLLFSFIHSFIHCTLPLSLSFQSCTGYHDLRSSHNPSCMELAFWWDRQTCNWNLCKKCGASAVADGEGWGTQPTCRANLVGLRSPPHMCMAPWS